MKFTDRIKGMLILFTNSMCILEEGNKDMVPLSRKISLQVEQLLTIQLSNEE